MNYNNLTLYDLQKEAFQLGIKPFRGSGVDRTYLIEKIKEKLEETREEFIDEDGTSAEDILFEQNRDLYDFILPVIDNVPSIRQHPEAPFKENPFNMILDELNAMTELEHKIIETLINGNEKEILALLPDYSQRLYDIFQKYPVLSYAILARRISKEPWIQVAVVQSGASGLYPHSDIIDESFSSFSNLHLFYEIKDISEAIAFIKAKGFDKIYIELFWLRLLQYIKHDKENKIPREYYRLFEMEKKEGIPLPLNREIMNILDDIYETYRESYPEEALIFAKAVTRSIVSNKRKNTDCIIYLIASKMFRQVVNRIRKLKWSSSKTEISDLVSAFIDPFLFIDDDLVIKKLGMELIPVEESRVVTFVLGDLIASTHWLDVFANMKIYGRNCGILANKNVVDLGTLMVKTLYKTIEPLSFQISLFLDGLLMVLDDKNIPIFIYHLNHVRNPRRYVQCIVNDYRDLKRYYLPGLH